MWIQHTREREFPTSSRVIRENARTWRHLLANRAVRAGRPGAATWPSLEYACHVRDVYRRYHGRVALMLAEDDALFPSWDQDASAVDDAYEIQDPAEVIENLVAAAEQLANQLAQIDGVDDPPCLGRVEPASLRAS